MTINNIKHNFEVMRVMKGASKSIHISCIITSAHSRICISMLVSRSSAFSFALFITFIASIMWCGYLFINGLYIQKRLTDNWET